MSDNLLATYARVERDRVNLGDKTEALNSFLSSPAMKELDIEERNILHKQLGFMRLYRDTLDERMDRMWKVLEA